MNADLTVLAPVKYQFVCFELSAGTMTCFIRLSFTRIPLFTSSHSDVPSDVTFTVAGGDGDRRGGCFAGQTRLRTGRVPQTVHGRVLVR